MSSLKYKIPANQPVELEKKVKVEKKTDQPEKKKERFISVTERLQRPLHESCLNQ